jgi:hypothetical protein
LDRSIPAQDDSGDCWKKPETRKLGYAKSMVPEGGREMKDSVLNFEWSLLGYHVQQESWWATPHVRVTAPDKRVHQISVSTAESYGLVTATTVREKKAALCAFEYGRLVQLGAATREAMDAYRRHEQYFNSHFGS